jgi:hypothetical protein
MTVEAIALGVFLFVALTVGGLRFLRAPGPVEPHKPEITEYRGPLFSHRDRY